MSIARLASALCRVVDIVVALLLGSVIVLALAEVFFRYVVQAALVWPVEVSRLFFIWLTFLGAAGAVHRGTHFRLVIVRRYLKPSLRARLEVVSDAVILLLSSVLLLRGLEMVDRTAVQQTGVLLIPMSYWYLAIPASAALAVAFVLLRWGTMLQERRFSPPGT